MLTTWSRYGNPDGRNDLAPFFLRPVQAPTFVRAAAKQNGAKILHTRGVEEIRGKLFDLASRSLLSHIDQTARA